MSIVDLPTELILEIGQYILLQDPHHCSLSFLSQTCQRFYDIFASSINAFHVRSISTSPIRVNFVPTARWPERENQNSSITLLDGDFKVMSFKLRGSHTLDDTRCFRKLISQANSISRIEVDVGNLDVDLRLLACFLNTCVQRQDLHLKVVHGAHQIVCEGGPFIFNFSAAEAAGPPRLRVKPVKKTWQDVLWGALSPLSSKLVLPRTSIKKEPENASPKIISSTTICHGVEIRVVHRAPRLEIPHPRVAPRLTGLWMEGDSLLTATIYPWTRDIMNAAPLTHLSITRSNLTLFSWSQILSASVIPTLTHLAIGRVNVAFPDLLLFFSRHSSLRVINLSDNEPIGTVSFGIAGKPSSESDLLPKLDTLVASPDYIYPFICHHQDGYFQQLTAYELRPVPAAPGEHLCDRQFRPIFEHIVSHPQSRLSITLSRMSLERLIVWLLDTSDHPTIDGIRRLPGIQNLVVLVPDASFPQQLIADNVLLLLVAAQGGLMDSSVSVTDDRILLDRLFHTVCPDLQHIEFKECLTDR